jgi:DDE family transposase
VRAPRGRLRGRPRQEPAPAQLAQSWLDGTTQAFAATQTLQRHFGEFAYRAGTWPRLRRVIVKAEHNARGANPRLLVTSLANAPQELYERGYCARGDMENRIKECQPGLFADRTSCHLWWPNQFRLLLASLAYVLMERLRAIGLAGTELARAQVCLDAALPLAQARRAHPQEHPPHPLLPRQRLPPPGGLGPCRPPTSTGSSLSATPWCARSASHRCSTPERSNSPDGRDLRPRTITATRGF